MLVAVFHGVGAGPAAALHHVFVRDAQHQTDTGIDVAQIVEADGRKTVSLTEAVQALEYIIGVVGIQEARGALFNETEYVIRAGNHARREGRFCAFGYPFALLIPDEGLADRDRLVGEVKVLLLQGHDLGPAQAQPEASRI